MYTRFLTYVCLTALLLMLTGTTIQAQTGDAYRQWASSATASTEFSSSSWSASQTVGEPDALSCGTSSSAWASEASDTVDWLEVSYEVPVYATAVNVVQNSNPNYVTEVQLIDMDDNYISVYTGAGEEITDPCPYTLAVTFDQTEAAIKGVRVTVDQTALNDWNEIDAVELVGIPTEDAVLPEESMAEEDAAEEETTAEADTDTATEAAPTGGFAGFEPTDAPLEGITPMDVVLTSAPAPAFPEDLPLATDAGIHQYVSTSYVNDITMFEDKVWAATMGGILTYDFATGEVRTYTTLDGLPHTATYAIEVCPMLNQPLIAGGRGGLSVYDAATDTWQDANAILGAQPDSPLADALNLFGTEETFNVIYCDADRNEILLDYDDLGVIDLETGAVNQYTDSEGFLTVNDAVTFGEDEYLVASRFDGLSRVMDGLATTYNADEETFPIDTVRYISKSADGVVWLTGEKLVRIYDGTIKVYDESVNEDMFSGTAGKSAVAPDGTLWVTLNGRSICHFDPSTETCLETFVLAETEGMADGTIWSMHVDENGVFYYGTQEDGMSMYDGSRWYHLRVDTELLPHYTVSDIVQDIDGGTWIANNIGVVYISPDGSTTELIDSHEIFDFTVFRSAAEITPDPDGGVWVMFGRFLAHFDGTEWSLDVTRDDVPNIGSGSSSFYFLNTDTQGRVWFGGIHGLSIWDGETLINMGVEEGWDADDIDLIDILPDGDAMLAATSEGVMRFEDTDFEIMLNEENDGLRGNVSSLARAGNGDLLIGTWQGLYRYDGSTVTPIDEVSGWVRDLSASGDQILVGVWDTSDQSGAHYFDGSTWQHLTIADGLPTNDIQEVFIAEDGTLWMGGGSGSSSNGGGLLRLVP